MAKNGSFPCRSVALLFFVIFITWISLASGKSVNPPTIGELVDSFVILNSVKKDDFLTQLRWAKNFVAPEDVPVFLFLLFNKIGLRDRPTYESAMRDTATIEAFEDAVIKNA
uniref:Uncharacterized protein n=1 Tax=Bracon brevicornis TaxID=1563983 RepID=A0A6V7JI26_9HYME